MGDDSFAGILRAVANVTDDIAAMFGYAYDMHHKVDDDERRSLREGLIESMIDWLLRRDSETAKSLIQAARLQSPGRLVSIGRQGTIENDGRRTDIDLGFENGLATIELKVGAEFSKGQLDSYCGELKRARRGKAPSYRAYLLVLTREADRPKADRAVQVIRPRPGVDVRTVTFDELAAKDSRWRIVARTAEELVSPRQPVAGSAAVFRSRAVATWAEEALQDLGRLRSADTRLDLARDLGRPRSARRLGPNVPRFSADQRNVHAAFFSYLGSEKFACIDIAPTEVRFPNDGALVWARFRPGDEWLSFPASNPPNAIRDEAGGAVEAVWQVLWIVVRRLRAVGWETPRPQPAVTMNGLMGVRLKHGHAEFIVAFDPRWSTWRSHGPISVISGGSTTSAVAEEWHLERNLGATSLDLWIERAVEAVLREADRQLRKSA